MDEEVLLGCHGVREGECFEFETHARGGKGFTVRAEHGKIHATPPGGGKVVRFDDVVRIFLPTFSFRGIRYHCLDHSAALALVRANCGVYTYLFIGESIFTFETNEEIKVFESDPSENVAAMMLASFEEMQSREKRWRVHAPEARAFSQNQIYRLQPDRAHPRDGI